MPVKISKVHDNRRQWGPPITIVKVNLAAQLHVKNLSRSNSITIGWPASWGHPNNNNL